MQRLILPLLVAALSLVTLGASHVRAQANATFSGGLGAPLTLKLNAPVVYVITTASANLAPAFIFQGTGNVFGGGNSTATSTITYTINNGTPQTLSILQSGYTTGSTVTAADLLLYNNASATLAVGDTVRLLAGTLTTTNNVAAAPPASGAYQTFVVNPSGTKLDAVNGTSVPEPGTWALVGVGAAGLGVVVLRRARRPRAS